MRGKGDLKKRIGVNICFQYLPGLDHALLCRRDMLWLIGKDSCKGLAEPEWFTDHSGSVRAWWGHASMHLPQSTHFPSSSFSRKFLSSEKTSRGQMLMHAPQSTHSLSFTLIPCSSMCTVAPRRIIVSLTSLHCSSGTSISASPSDE